MSSPSDEMPPLDPQLEAVYRRGYALRRRRTVARVAGAAAVLQMLVAVPLALASPSPPHQLRTVDGDLATTTSEAPESTTTSPTPASTVVASPRRTTTTLVCRNSTNPACGPFRWDPDPGPNAPMTASLTYEPAHPHVGEPVYFRPDFEDPDASYVWGGCSDFGDGPHEPQYSCLDGSRWDGTQPDYCAPNRYGPWTPPPRESTRARYGPPPERGAPYYYQHPGTYVVRFTARSDSTLCGAHEPYGSEAEVSVTIVVLPAETTTSTTNTATSTTSTTTLL